MYFVFSQTIAALTEHDVLMYPERGIIPLGASADQTESNVPQEKQNSCCCCFGYNEVKCSKKEARFLLLLQWI